MLVNTNHATNRNDLPPRLQLMDYILPLAVGMQIQQILHCLFVDLVRACDHRTIQIPKADCSRNDIPGPPWDVWIRCVSLDQGMLPNFRHLDPPLRLKHHHATQKIFGFRREIVAVFGSP